LLPIPYDYCVPCGTFAEYIPLFPTPNEFSNYYIEVPPNGSNGIPISSITSFSPSGDGQLSLITNNYVSLFYPHPL
jgi:hypothetical protein